MNRIPYGLATDMWSLGCMIVTMLTGSPPFQSSIVKTTLEKVVDQEYICPSHFSTRISDLIGSLLQKDPSKRPLITDLLKHPFFTPRISRIDSGLVMNDSLSSSRGSERYSRGPSPVVDSDRLYGTESRSSSHLKSSVNDERRLDSRGSTPPNVLSSQKQHSDSRSSTPHARKYNVEIATPASQPSSHYIDSRASLPYTSKSVPVSRETTPTHSNNFNFDSSTSTPQQNAYYNDSRASTPQAFNSRPPSVQGNHVMDPRSIIQPNENLKPPSAYRESNIDSQKKFFSSSTITSKDNGSNRSTLINSWHSKSLNETRPLNSKPPPIPKLEELKPFSTARLKPISQTTKYGIVKIEDDGRVCLDFKDEKYIFSVSSNSESVFICNLGVFIR